MVVVKVRLARDIEGLYDRVNRAMDELMGLTRPVPAHTGRGWVPEADMIETRDRVVVRVNLAGVRKEDIEVAFDEHYLRVEGMRLPALSAGTEGRYHRLELGSGAFERVFRIPVRIDPDRIGATLADGILTVRMAKPAGEREEHPRPSR